MSLPAAPSEDSKMYRCPVVPEDGTACGLRFADQKRLLLHVRFHGLSHTVNLLCVTNQCYYCMSVFKTRSTAIRHIKRALQTGTCYADRSWQVCEPTIISPVCAYKSDLLAHLQIHIRTHASLHPKRLVFSKSDSLRYRHGGLGHQEGHLQVKARVAGRHSRSFPFILCMIWPHRMYHMGP